MTKQSAYADINGISIHYEQSGNPDGFPLAMLHGGLGSTRDLDVLTEYLGTHFRLISIDLRGQGRSSLGDVPLSYAQYQSDVQALLDWLGISRYFLFGFSDGGIVAYRLAVQNPAQVTRLLTLGSSWRLEEGDPAVEKLRGLTVEMWTELFPEGVAYYQASNPAPNFPALVEAVKTLWLDTKESGYPCDLVAQIDCPTLIMRGDNDFLFSLEEAVALKARIKDVSFANIPFTTHAAHQELPALVGPIIRQFFLQPNQTP
ncbi:MULTISPECIES: alpha/beta hydrolase [unclassified Pseudoalteromonas]|uniref:alpha/beta fold hydrolase n=1 Tax=unclassified Pseudoalteromonas TaxID=194690 RepID=UPI0020976C0C|nr:alpha/beta hydrolase [Pseudoalteromonas sp. XMcav2-N]MCO7187208.1 alpha/beta hydrolase [Pseudoalteromonas sp. XMcav2-N]